MINKAKAQMIKENIIAPIVELLPNPSESAINLLFYTGIIESNFAYIHQKNGPALSWWQIEPKTHNDIWKSYLAYRPEISDKLNAVSDVLGDEEELKTNPFYACAMARIHYLRVPEALPKFDARAGMARYWKKYYNTELGKGTEQKFLERLTEWGI